MRDDNFRDRLQPSGLRRAPVPRSATGASPKSTTDRTINIKLQLPALPSLPSRRVLMRVAAVIGVVGLSAGMYALGKHGGTDSSAVGDASSASANVAGATAAGSGTSTNTSAASPTGNTVSIATYYPKNLPKGYTYNNDAKPLKPDVLYYSIAGPDKQVFYVTQQPIPDNFDFTAFNKKFLSPDTFESEAGTVTAGQVGANMLGSIRTKKNTWIIINTTSGKLLPQLETVARSLH